MNGGEGGRRKDIPQVMSRLDHLPDCLIDNYYEIPECKEIERFPECEDFRNCCYEEERSTYNHGFLKCIQGPPPPDDFCEPNQCYSSTKTGNCRCEYEHDYEYYELPDDADDGK